MAHNALLLRCGQNYELREDGEQTQLSIEIWGICVGRAGCTEKGIPNMRGMGAERAEAEVRAAGHSPYARAKESLGRKEKTNGRDPPCRKEGVPGWHTFHARKNHDDGLAGG